MPLVLHEKVMQVGEVRVREIVGAEVIVAAEVVIVVVSTDLMTGAEVVEIDHITQSGG